MAFISNESRSTKSTKKSKSKAKPNTKCSWCDRKRARNDLCNVCRQKVESRARRLMEQKLEGDMDVVQKVMKYLNQNIPMNRMSNQQIMGLILECFPYLMLKFQSENTYRGKKGNRCWCLPESVLKKLITQFYIKDIESTAIVQKGGRQELCDLLMSSVTKSFSNFGVNNIKLNLTEDGDNDIDIKIKSHKMKMKMEKNPFNINSMNSINSNSGSRALKRSTMDIQSGSMSMAPPRKRTRMDNNHNTMNMPPSMDNNNEIMPDHQIWGRSDTELLSFDITKLDSFLHKFEREVLDGAEWEKIEPQNRVNFLKGRCKEFTKILTELRDYVMHLRVKVSNNEQNVASLAAKNQEIHQMKQRMDEMINSNPETEKLFRCVTNLLQKLAPSPVDSVMLRSNMDKLEQYHDLACSELTESIRSFESIGAKLGHQRSSDMTLKQYAAHIHVNIVNNNQNNNASLTSLYMNNNRASPSNPPLPPKTPSISSTNSSSTIYHNVQNQNQNQIQIQNPNQSQFNNLPPLVASTAPNQQNMPMNVNNQSRMNHHINVHNANQHNVNMSSSQSHQHHNNGNNQSQMQQQQHQHQQFQGQQSILLAPIGSVSSSYPMTSMASSMMSPTNFVTLQQPTTIPLNAAALNSLDTTTFAVDESNKFGSFMNMNDYIGCESESDATDSIFCHYQQQYQHNVI